MIETKKYTTVMSKILKERSIGNFMLQKKVIPKGTELQMYDRKIGRIYWDVIDADFPIVVLCEKKDDSWDVWMSDAPFEQESTLPAVEMAKGEVLICGLGIGYLPTMIKNKKSVKSIDIVELNKEVIDLVFDQIKNPKMNLIHADAWKYLAETEKKYDFIHIDIWGSITAPLREVGKAIKLGKRCLKPNGKIRCWLQELYDRIIDKIPKKPIHITGLAGIYPPCLICGKTFRNDYAGLCMDCADALGVSEVFMNEKKREKHVKTVYICANCGRRSEKKRKNCPRCGGTMIPHSVVE
jgi:DNA-directed RNA polymerase subunit RPC12/RpoP